VKDAECPDAAAHGGLQPPRGGGEDDARGWSSARIVETKKSSCFWKGAAAHGAALREPRLPNSHLVRARGDARGSSGGGSARWQASRCRGRCRTWRPPPNRRVSPVRPTSCVVIHSTRRRVSAAAALRVQLVAPHGWARVRVRVRSNPNPNPNPGRAFVWTHARQFLRVQRLEEAGRGWIHSPCWPEEI